MFLVPLWVLGFAYISRDHLLFRCFLFFLCLLLLLLLLRLLLVFSSSSSSSSSCLVVGFTFFFSGSNLQFVERTPSMRIFLEIAFRITDILLCCRGEETPMAEDNHPSQHDMTHANPTTSKGSCNSKSSLHGKR